MKSLDAKLASIHAAPGSQDLELTGTSAAYAG
jgi:hypothetical protein